MPTDRCLADFIGVWALERRITHGDGTTAVFSGQAVFEPDENGLLYHETGLLLLGQGAPLTATQRYRWGADLQVFFEDGRPFHRVPPSGGAAAHWCDPDQYDGFYDFAAWPAFTVTWTVKGPRKDYCTLSRYTRSGSR